MDISYFEKPTKHPYDMLNGYRHSFEKERVLAFILSKCIDAGDFIPVQTEYSHPYMVDDGLLVEDPDGYMLTKKSIGLLYGVYGK